MSFGGPSTEVFETSIWPCFTADCHWALSDAIERLGELSVSEGNTAEYVIDTDGLPEGTIGIYHFNGLRNIRLNTQSWPSDMRAALLSATLCIGNVAIETIEPQKLAGHVTDLQFKIFQGYNFLPTFTLDEPLTVRLEFDDIVKGLPQRTLAAEGLLVRIKKRNVPFFIAGGPQAVVTWDGQQLRIFQTASGNVNGMRDAAEDTWLRGADGLDSTGGADGSGGPTDDDKKLWTNKNSKRIISLFNQDSAVTQGLFGAMDEDNEASSQAPAGLFGAHFQGPFPGGLGGPPSPVLPQPPTPRRAAQQWAVAHDDDADFEDLQAALALNYSANQGPVINSNATWVPQALVTPPSAPRVPAAPTAPVISTEPAQPTPVGGATDGPAAQA